MTAQQFDRRTRASAASWLVGAMTLTADGPDWPRPPDSPDAVAALARHHRVEGWARARARASGLVLPGIDESVRRAVAAHQRVVEDLALADAVLAEAGVPYLVVKGPALVSQFYAGPQWRRSSDLDLVVRPADVATTLSALEGRGAAVLDANWPLLGLLGVHELRVRTPSGGLVDLHWSLGPRWGTAAASPAVGDLLLRAQRVPMGTTSALTLDWADTVVHLASHSAAAGGDRLVWCADLRAALDATPADSAEALASRAAEWGAAPALFVMLHRTSRVLDIQPPAGLLEQLNPGGGWGTLVTWATRRSPGAVWDGEPSWFRLVARSARATAAESWQALAGRAFRAASRRVGLGEGPLRGHLDPRSGLYPSGGAADREAFLARLTEQEATRS